jgi:ubiquinone/menaquinone biosynthesis C-methylase UbiE
MAFFSRYLFPRLMDVIMRDPKVDELRAETLTDARGLVLEVGFGTGLNLKHYSEQVDRLVAVEPNPGMAPIAAKRQAAARIPIEVHEAKAEALPFPDAHFDTVVTTATLCSVGDLELSLGEIRRVLKPGGSYLLLEHGLSDDPKIQVWQRRLNGLQMFLADGCHIDRPIAGSVEAAGFRFERVRTAYLPKGPKTHSFMTIAKASKA